MELCRRAATTPEDPVPDFETLGAENGRPLPEIGPDDLTPQLLRAAILRHGALLVRGLVSAQDCVPLRAEIDRAFDARDALAEGRGVNDGYYEEFDPDAPDAGAQTAGSAGGQPAVGRWAHKGSGIWAADSPRGMFVMLETFGKVGLTRLAREYLGEPPAVSVQKCTLRKALPPEEPALPGWHQDGRFLGDVRSLNVWLSLSHCGDEAPGLDLVPRRLDHIVPTGTEGAPMKWVVSPAMAEEAANGLPILRPIFEPGDVMLFDHLYLHATAADPLMSKPRYAVESWFFGPSAFPMDVYSQGRAYVPLAT